MSSFRRHLRHVSAFALLLWMFAAGAALAHVCAAHVDLDTGDCCATVQEATLRADAFSEPAAPIAGAQSVVSPSASFSFAASASMRPRLANTPLWNDSGQRIPVVLLRLAL